MAGRFPPVQVQTHHPQLLASERQVYDHGDPVPVGSDVSAQIGNHNRFALSSAVSGADDEVPGVHEYGRHGAKIDRETKLSVRFKNGSRVLALPGSEKTIRGISAVTLFVEDEAARAPDDLYNSIRPMLAVSNGRLILMSTPFGKRGHFHHIWAEEQNWEKIEVKAEQCPRISPDFLQDERLNNPWFEQEYHCAFVDTEHQIFNYDVVASAFKEGIETLVFD